MDWKLLHEFDVEWICFWRNRFLESTKLAGFYVIKRTNPCSPYVAPTPTVEFERFCEVRQLRLGKFFYFADRSFGLLAPFELTSEISSRAIHHRVCECSSQTLLELRIRYFFYFLFQIMFTSRTVNVNLLVISRKMEGESFISFSA